MPTPSIPPFHAVWTLAADGRCVSFVASTDGLLPPLAGATLPAWLEAIGVAPEPMATAAAALAARAPYHAELPVACADGRTRHLQCARCHCQVAATAVTSRT